MNNLQKIRMEKGMPQAELARRIGITQSGISLMEVCDVNPGRELLKKICQALEVSEEVFHIDDEHVPVPCIREKKREKRREPRQNRGGKIAHDTRKRCIYRHTFPDGKIYIGQTISGNEESRWKEGVGYYGQKKVFAAIVKYGWDNIRHEIILDGLTAEEADAEEHRLIREYDSIASGYNTSK